MSRLHEVASGVAVAPQVTEAEIGEIARLGYGTLINNRPDGEEPGQLTAAEAKAVAARHGLAYVHIPVTAPSITAADVAAYAGALEGSAKPVVAHCRSGTRSYLLWGLVQVLRKGADPAAIVAAAAAKGFDLSALPALAARLRG